MKTLLLLIAITCFSALQCGCTTDLKIGDKAPDFELRNQDDEMVKLADFKGKKVALYFYPADSTPGCTQQACSLRDAFDVLKEADITILGLSKGSVKSKQKFIKSQHLNFPLLIATKDVLKAYGVNKGFLHFFFGTPKRWTFLVDENGIIVAIIKNVNTKNHAQQILDAFNAAQ
jgi:peroxiredoxin Q/BCP